MWRATEIAGLLIIAVAVGMILSIQHLCDPSFTLNYYLQSAHPWQGVFSHCQLAGAAGTAPPWLHHILADLLAAALALGAALVLWAVWRLVRRAAQARQMVSVRILLSRDDAAQPLTVGATFDAWAQTVENRYLPALMGNDSLALDLVRDAEGRLLLFLRGTERTVGAIEARLRATWTSVRTERQDVPRVDGAFAVSVTPRYRNTVTRGFRSYRDYSHSVTESILAVLDEANGPAHLQFVLSPRSAKYNARAEREQRRYEQDAMARAAVDPAQGGLGMGEQAQLQSVVKTAGRQWWRTEIRVVAQSVATGQAVVGALNEAAAENSWVYHRVWQSKVRRAWESWRRTGMPGVWPIVGCTSLPGVFLATLWQLPSARLRVSGLLREPTRRGPALLSIPTDGGRDGEQPRGVVPVVDEAGRRILLPESDLQGNVLAVGSQGSGKSTVLRRFASFLAARPDWSGFVIDFKGSLAEAVRGIVPEGRPVVAWHAGRSGAAWGYNPFAGADPAEWDLTTDRILYSMKQAWTDGSILARSEDYLRHAVAATILMGQTAAGFRFTREVLATPPMWADLAETIREPAVRSWFAVQSQAYVDDPKGTTSALAAPLNKLTALVFGERRAAATSSPVSLDLRQIMRSRGIVIVNLAAGELGDDNAALIGILLLAGIWDAIREVRAPTMLVLDEAHRLLGETFFRLVAEGREYGARVALGLQFLGQISDERARDTVRELVQNLFLFRSQNVKEAAEHSQLLARVYANMISPQEEIQDILAFTPDDLTNLPNYHCVARLLIGGRPQSAFLGQTIRTEPGWAGADWGTCPEEWLLRAPQPERPSVAIEEPPATTTDTASTPEPAPAAPESEPAAGAQADDEDEVIAVMEAPHPQEKPEAQAAPVGEAVSAPVSDAEAEVSDDGRGSDQPDRKRMVLPVGCGATPENGLAAGLTADLPAGVTEEDLRTLVGRFGPEVASAALASLRRRTGVRNPGGYLYRAAVGITEERGAATSKEGGE